jgi:lactam utilization protein B
MRNTLLTLTLGSLLASCGTKSTPPLPSPAPDQVPSTSTSVAMATDDRCDAVRDLMVDTVIHQLLAPVSYGRGYHGDMPAMDYAKDASAKLEASQAAPAGMATAAPGPQHYTTTNVQERGVDEADLVKTDGKHVYTIRNNELLIAKTWPVADSELVARVQFKKLVASQIYLHGDEVIVTGAASDGTTQATRVVVLDISNRARPKVDRTYDVDGYITSSRVVGDDLYLVQSSAMQLPPKLFEVATKTLGQIRRADQQSLRPWEVQARIARTLRTTLRAELSRDQIASSLPQIRSDGMKRTMQCGDLFVPQNNIGLGLTSIAKISLAQGRDEIVGAMVSGGQVYASTESLYVSAPGYAWNEQGMATYGTAIHQFSLGGREGKPGYVASGSVDGQLLNQFSMSEWKGDLRVATTDEHGNHLFVMRPKGRTLDTIGTLRGLAKGERIYAGRMFGDKGYLVTFRQTDPLFTLDLSNPEKPKLAGELKVNGFSTYLHPMGNDLLLAIGQDANDDGRVSGLHLQVFDVSNPAKPTRRHHEKLSSWSTYSSSAAERDHHAFNYDPVSGVLAIPTAGTTDNGEQYSGLVVYGVDPSRGFTLHGRVSHRQLATEVVDGMCPVEEDPWMKCERSTGSIAQFAQIDRSVVIDNHLVTLGTGGLEIHALDKLARREARILWPLTTDIQSRIVVSAD